MNLGPTEIVLIILVIVVLFGAKKLPELGRGLGQGIKEFKKSAKGIMDDEEEKADKPKPGSET